MFFVIFVEGRQSILNFASGSEMLYYSRRIGKRPSYTPSKEADEYRRMPENTTILNALKLTGRTTNGWTFGALQSITAIEKAKIVHDGSTRHPVAEPLTNYSLGRVQKEFNQGETVIGASLTGVNRKIDDVMLEFLPVAAYTGGLEFKHQFVNRRYYANVDVMGSTLSGSEQAMIRLQRDTRHYFQRPDADYVTVDSSATRLSGHGGRQRRGQLDRTCPNRLAVARIGVE